MTQSISRWMIVFYAVLAVGLIAAIYHFANGRYGNGIIAISAVLVGLLLQRQIARMPWAPGPVQAHEPHTPPLHLAQRWRGGPENRTGWLSNSILAGFPATVVMTMVLIAGFVLSRAFAVENGNLLERWFWGLTNNTLTESGYDVPLAAFGLNVLAGLVWAGVYGRLFEPRLSGPAWRRGMTFSLIPWILSLVVFFPIVGAGFFGASLDAGVLPAIGNLLLHLVYGAVLGSMYVVPDRSYADAERGSEWEADWQNRGLTIGLVGGLAVGTIVGSALALFAANTDATATEMLLAGAASGTMVGAIAGPLFGLSVGARTEPSQQQPQHQHQPTS